MRFEITQMLFDYRLQILQSGFKHTSFYKRTNLFQGMLFKNLSFKDVYFKNVDFKFCTFDESLNLEGAVFESCTFDDCSMSPKTLEMIKRQSINSTFENVLIFN